MMMCMRLLSKSSTIDSIGYKRDRGKMGKNPDHTAQDKTMIRYEQVKDTGNLLKSLTGLNRMAFEKLLPAFEEAYEADLERRDRERAVPRQRARGAGQKGAIPRLEDKLLFILFYFRLYPVQTVQGFLFGMGQPQANEWIHRLTPILNAALGHEMQLPAREPGDIEAVLKACPGLEFVIDGTERPIRRPKDKDKQRRYYSGKKKRHTVKNNVIKSRSSRKIKVLSRTVEGKKHDKKLADEQGIPFPPGSKLWQDTGYQGYAPEGVQTFQPKKKPRGRELTPEEKAANATLSGQRIGVEHSIGGVKVFRIVHDTFRNLREGFDDLAMETACGLHNLRVDFPLSS
jgi:hypothetical protein